MAKCKKLVCIATTDSAVWDFTVGKEYTLFGDINNDPHVVSDNGFHLYLIESEGGKMVGAGASHHQFKDVKK